MCVIYNTMSQGVVVHIHPIKIMVKMNTEKDYQLFTFSMLSHPDLEGMNSSGLSSANGDYTLPYFTNSVKIPYGVLVNRDMKYIAEFFFNKSRFEKIMRKYMDGYVDENDLYGSPVLGEIVESKRELDDTILNTLSKLDENIEYNIHSMLKLLFPISQEFDAVYSNTYQHYIRNELNTNLFYFDIKRPFWSGNNGYIKSGSGDYIISNVIWLNDVVNHPIYRKFINNYITNIREREKMIKKTEYQYREKMFDMVLMLNSLFENKAPTGANTPIAVSSVVNNVFTQLYDELLKIYKSIGTGTISQSLQLKRTVLETILLDHILPLVNNKSGLDKSAVSVFEKTEVQKSIETLINPDDNKLNKREFKTKFGEYENAYLDTVNAVIKMNNLIYEYNSKSEFKISLKSENQSKLSKLYEVCVAVKAVKVVVDFINMRLRKIDLNDKNTDDTTKPKEELDIINVIKKQYPSYAALSNLVNESVSNVIPPTRDTSNYMLRNELNKIRMASAKPIKANSCTEVKDFFSDVYYKFINNTGFTSFDESYMYTGVNIVSEAYDDKSSAKSTGQVFEIYLLMDLVNRKKFETKQDRCKLGDDIITNELNNLLTSKNSNLANLIRNYDQFHSNKSETTASSSVPVKEHKELVGTKQGGSGKKSIRKSRKRMHNYKLTYLPKYTNRKLTRKTPPLR